MRTTLTFVLALAALPAAAQDKLALDGIAHVAFRVSDLAASRDFYRKLGFEQAFEFSDAAGTTVSYMKVNDRQFIELYRRGQTAKEVASQPLGLMHICFDTRDMEGLHAEYLKREMKPTDTQKARAGNLLFTMLDPKGQLLEYTQYMPGSLHSNARGQYLSDRRISQHLVRAVTAVNDVAAERAFYMMMPGDFVVMQFGHNDGGALDGVQGARVSLPGTGDETKEVQNELVHSYGWYLKQLIAQTRAKGATLVVCSLVPRKIWKDGKIARNSEDYAAWASAVAQSEHTPFLDLNEIIAREYDRLGPEKVDALFADEHTHTSRAGAELSAAIVATALKELKAIPIESTSAK